tara:strand:- start:950 stop:1291 length:342 start_codon:yes stop_codon:yes gene_type:complete
VGEGELGGGGGADAGGADAAANAGGDRPGVPAVRAPPPPVPLVMGGIAPRREGVGCCRELLNDVGYLVLSAVLSLVPWWRPVEQRLAVPAPVDPVVAAAPAVPVAPHAHEHAD